MLHLCRASVRLDFTELQNVQPDRRDSLHNVRNIKTHTHSRNVGDHNEAMTSCWGYKNIAFRLCCCRSCAEAGLAGEAGFHGPL